MKRRRATGELFGPGIASDPAFVNLRQPVHYSQANAKSFAERLWKDYHPHADPNFLMEIRTDFCARFWEMYLCCALIEQSTTRGYSVSCPKPGPDILLESSSGRIWMEAVSPTNGELGKADSLVEPEFPSIHVGSNKQKPRRPNPSSGSIPEEKIVLRYTTAIREKYRKYLCYLQAGLVDKNDAYVIAINKSRLAYRLAAAEIDLPRFLKAVYPIGQLEVLIDIDARRIVGAQNRPRFSIPKFNQSPVSVQSFTLGRKRGISAVLCSDADASWSTSPLGSDFELAHHPRARKAIPRGLIPTAREWWAELNAERGELYCDPPRTPSP
jgi:hypothetical protein